MPHLSTLSLRCRFYLTYQFHYPCLFKILSFLKQTNLFSKVKLINKILQKSIETLKYSSSVKILHTNFLSIEDRNTKTSMKRLQFCLSQKFLKNTIYNFIKKLLLLNLYLYTKTFFMYLCLMLKF